MIDVPTGKRLAIALLGLCESGLWLQSNVSIAAINRPYRVWRKSICRIAQAECCFSSRLKRTMKIP
jgi:hypothetical protein